MGEKIKGYKVFNSDWTCRGFQYEVGKVFEEDVTPSYCGRGFHFYLKASDCFNHYKFSPDNKVAEVIALGDVDYADNNTKCCTNRIHIVREVPWDEVLRIVNIGKDCTGFCNTSKCNTGDYNTGDYNTGDRNTGDRNAGDRNTGNWNTGYWNTGYWNTGNWNTGDYNTGYWNTGKYNTGKCNTGDWNAGDYNTGDWNTGDRNVGKCNTDDRNTGNYNTGDYNTGNWNTDGRNTGNWNTGHRNAGDCNTGNWNTGHRNAGDYNTGDWNTGHCNTGDWNFSSFNTGCFNTEEQKIVMFNKLSNWTYDQWMDSDARYLLNRIPKNVVKWVYSFDMTDEEKADYPTYETTGGYLKVLDESECGQLWWDGLNKEQREIIFSLPNFNPDVFEQCTGIKVNAC